MGKTSLAKVIGESFPGSVHLDLERPADLARLDDPELYLRQYRDSLVILDEIQRRPGLFPVLRVLADESGRCGQFLVLGSASPELLRQSSETLAGRIIFHELAPLSLTEVAAQGIEATNLWSRGGFPRSYLAKNDGASFRWRQAFIATYLERDLPQLGVRTPASELRRFWQMLAHVHGQLHNASDLARSLGVAAPTVNRYLGILEDTFVARRLQPYYVNISKRLVKRPKVYLRDSGLLHALLGLLDVDHLLGHPIVGASFEGWVVEQVGGKL
ncbi:MAG: ATP-binding protein, partial [bacterium]|nr:ATP-binding protein [bacterium]